MRGETRYLVSMSSAGETGALVPSEALGSASPASPRWAVRRHDGSILRGGSGCAVMAVLNVTPDSFSDGGKYLDAERARAHIDALIAQGADLVDIGAESTRPGAVSLSPDEEWRRLAPLFALLDRVALPVALSIDTRHAATAERAAEHGVALLNLPFPRDLLASPSRPWASEGRAAGPPAASAELKRLLLCFDAIVVMHSRGTPATMREQTDYGDNLCQTVVEELVTIAASLAGDDPVLRRRLIFDPGLGFAKTAEQSIELLSRTAWLHAQLQAPLLVGASRKSMLGAVTGLPVSSRLVPSVVAAVHAAQQGAAIVRVHDVAETRAALQLVQALGQASQKPLGGRPSTAPPADRKSQAHATEARE